MKKLHGTRRIGKIGKEQILSLRKNRAARLGAILLAFGFFGAPAALWGVEPSTDGTVTLTNDDHSFAAGKTYTGAEYPDGLFFQNDPSAAGRVDFYNLAAIGTQESPMSKVNGADIGVFTNQGTIHFSDLMTTSALTNVTGFSIVSTNTDGALTVNGTLINGGTLDVAGTISAASATNSGTIQNAKTLSVSGDLNQMTGSISDFGLLSVGGTLTNGGGGMIDGATAGQTPLLAKLSARQIGNTGTIQNVESVTATTLTNSGTIQNAGTVSASDSFINNKTTKNIGTIGGAVVNSGGTMENIGVFTGTLTNNGTLSMTGDSLKTTKIANLDQQMSGSLQVRIAKDGAVLTNDRYMVDSTAAINGGSVVVDEFAAPQEDYKIGDQWTFLSSEGSLSVNDPVTVTSNVALPTPILKFAAWNDTANYYLGVIRAKNYAQGATTYNQRQFGGYLDDIGNHFVPDSDLQDVLEKLDALSPGDGISAAGRHAMAEMDGAIYGSLATLAVSGQTIFNQQLNDVFRPQTLCSDEVCSPCSHIWGKYYGVDGDSDSDGNAFGGNYQINGVMVGGDVLRQQNANSCCRLGAYFGYGASDFNAEGLSERAKSDSYRGGVYLVHACGIDYLLANMHYGHSDYRVERHIDFLDRDHRGEFGDNEVTARIEKGWNVPFGAAILQPLAAFQYVWLDTESFTEEGTGATALSVDGRSNDSWRSEFGSRFLVNRTFSQGQLLNLNAKALWLHEFGCLYGETTAQFNNKGSVNFTGAVAPYTVRGNQSNRDWCDLGAGLDFTVDQFTVFGGYDCLFNGSERFHAGSVGIARRY